MVLRQRHEEVRQEEMRQGKPEKGATRLWQIWEDIDVNKDNKISRAELMAYAHEKFLPKRYIEEFLREAGRQPGGILIMYTPCYLLSLGGEKK